MTDLPLPSLVVLAGPNGAGKFTIAPALLRDELRVAEFINADVIAAGLSAFAPETAAIAAGRIMLSRAKELAARNESFALETTLASRTLAPGTGYSFHLVFLWLPSADVAVARVRDRVKLGGHDVSDATVRHRYDAGLKNFFTLYRAMATTWRVLDTSGAGAVVTLASGAGEHVEACSDRDRWVQLERGYLR